MGYSNYYFIKCSWGTCTISEKGPGFNLLLLKLFWGILLCISFSFGLDKTRLRGAMIRALHIRGGSCRKEGNNLCFLCIMKKMRINMSNTVWSSKGYFNQILGKNFLMVQMQSTGINCLGRLWIFLQLKDFEDNLETHHLGVTLVCFDSAGSLRLEDLSRLFAALFLWFFCL